ncbi:MAG: hypothetical protein A2Y79_09165 [Deltaproteobacteria bacterium RBG_13_43_22]|nr:MAG: hypothetical protein A2Y79_09165 [Deltaproteobacteria bacterium RBG_13_43_22]
MEKINYVLNNMELVIWSVFPSIDTFRNFKAEKRNVSIVKTFIDLSQSGGLIPKKNEAKFEDLLKRCSELYKDRKPSMEFTFNDVIREIKRETSIKRLVKELKDLAKIFGFEEPDEVLFTRLKKEFHPNSIRKHHALMLFSIWLGLNKPALALNYQTLLGFPRTSSESTENEKNGVMATFAFMGENIDASMIDFLKKELPTCSRDLKIYYLNEKRIQYLATTCIARFPLKEGVVGFPSSYGEAIRDALFLAYQMVITWQLSPLCNARIHFIIALDAGPLDIAELTAKDLLSPELSLDYPIRLSHFAFIIAEQSEQKVIFKELKHPSVWAVEHFWAFPHLKGPPCLTPMRTKTENDAEWLPVTNETAKAFRNALVLGDSKLFKILSVINQYPPKILLSLEVANIITYRRLHHAAIRLLSLVLASDPTNYIARTMRISNFMFLGNYSKDLETAELFYDRGIYDGQFIDQYCPPDPVFYAEYSQIYWSKALKLIKFLRKGLIQDRIEERQTEILDYLKKAEHYAKKGAIFRIYADTRCTSYLMHFAAFRGLIEKDNRLLTDKNLPFVDTQGIFSSVAKSVYDTIGWIIPEDGGDAIDESFSDKRMTITVDTYLNSISSPSFFVCTLFFVCTVLWDFSEPEKQKQVIDRVLLFLDMALGKTEELKKLCLGIYSLTPAYPVIHSPGEYINWILKAKHSIQEIKETGNYETGMKLFLLQFDEETNSEPITFDLIQAEEKAMR